MSHRPGSHAGPMAYVGEFRPVGTTTQEVRAHEAPGHIRSRGSSGDRRDLCGSGSSDANTRPELPRVTAIWVRPRLRWGSARRGVLRPDRAGGSAQRSRVLLGGWAGLITRPAAVIAAPGHGAERPAATPAAAGRRASVGERTALLLRGKKG